MTSQTQRPYRKRLRAEQEAQTRERIAIATMELHETVGPARASVKAIAERAGVQRATVYRHFPDEQALFDACTGHFYSLHPMPNPEEWAAIDDPDARLRRALSDLYPWFGETENMLTNVMRDAAHVPPATRQRFLGYFGLVRQTLTAGRPERGRAKKRAEAAIGHAIGFATWRSLARDQGLDDEDAVELMAATVEAAARVTPRRRPAAA